MRTILIASDDAHAMAWVRHAFSQLGVTGTETALADIATHLSDREYDLVLIDGGRDPEPWIRTVEQIASDGSKIRMLLIVEKEGLAHLRLPVRVQADFVVRGASSDELGARVRAMLWPGEEVSDDEMIRVDDLTVNLATYQAYWGSTPVDFTYLEYALFSFLVTHPNRAYSREMLLRRVWGSDYFGGSRTVDVHVRRIRAKLPTEIGHRLETVRNVGYLWQM